MSLRRPSVWRLRGKTQVLSYVASPKSCLHCFLSGLEERVLFPCISGSLSVMGLILEEIFMMFMRLKSEINVKDMF